MAAVAAVTLAACAGGVTVSQVDVSTSYAPAELYVVGTGKNELRTVVVGNPFDISANAFQTAVLSSLVGRNLGPRLNLSTDPKREDARKRRVVIAFNLAHAREADKLCSGAAKTAAVTGSLTVTGVYCSGEHYLTQATARTEGVTGTDTEPFRQLMTQLAISLFPSENPNRRQDENCPEQC